MTALSRSIWVHRALTLDKTAFVAAVQTDAQQRPQRIRLTPVAGFTGEIIRGWEEGIAMMRVGEKRILIVPYDLAYGARGQPPRIPRQTSLVFEVEMIAIETYSSAPAPANP